MAQSEFVGVDGCHYGWFSVGLNRSGGHELEVFRTFDHLVAHHEAASLILVDIPIGLPKGSERRCCDRGARKLLGNPRSSSVFPTPTRHTVNQAASFPGDYNAAKATELRFAGRGISKQVFAIVPKIAEVDGVMLAREANATPQIREVHPEICFWALNNQHSMGFSKKKKEGISKRIRVLKELNQRAEDIFERGCSEFSRKCVARDDILDALAAAITAYRGHHQLQTVPETPHRDEKGLPMEMVFWKP